MVKKRRDMALFLSLFALLWMAVPVLGQEQGWEKKWNATIAAAKKEGSVVVAGPPDPMVRRELPARFKARFGIPVEYIGGRGSQTAAKLRAERRARVYTVDVFMGGLSTIASILHPEHMLEPLKPLLFLPEVVDPSKWRACIRCVLGPGVQNVRPNQNAQPDSQQTHPAHATCSARPFCASQMA